MRTDRKDITAGLVLCGLILILFAQAVFTGRPKVISLVGADIYNYFIYNRGFFSAQVKSGVFPFWNPYTFCGTPFAANIQSAVFYPLNLLFLVLPLSQAINWSQLLHLMLGSVGMYCLLRSFKLNRTASFAGAVILTFSAASMYRIMAGHLTVNNVLGWVPWAFIFWNRALERRSISAGLITGLIVGLQFLAGAPQYVYYTALFLGIYGFIRTLAAWKDGEPGKNLGAFIGLYVVVGISALLLAAAQFLPTLEFTGLSYREASRGIRFAGQFSFPPEKFITFLIPNFFGYGWKGMYWGRFYPWEVCGYIGILPLVMAVVAIGGVRNRQTTIWGIIAGVSLLGALGKNMPTFPIVCKLLPGWELFRGHTKLLYFTTFALCICAAWGIHACIEKLYKKDHEKLRLKLWSAIPIGIMLGVFITVYLIISGDPQRNLWGKLMEYVYSLGDVYINRAPLTDESWVRLARRMVYFSLPHPLLVLIFTAGLSAFFLKFRRTHLARHIWRACLLLVIIVDLGIFSWPLAARSFPISDAAMPLEVVRAADMMPDKGRTVSPSPGLRNGWQLRGFSAIDGYDANILDRYNRFIYGIQGFTGEVRPLSVEVRRINALFNILDMRILILPSETGVNNDIYPLLGAFQSGRQRYNIYGNRGAFPRAWMVYGTRVIGDPDEMLKYIAGKKWNPLKEVLFEAAPPDDAGTGESGGSAKVVEYSANRIVFEVDAQEAGYMVTSEIFYPGWKARVDDTEAEVLSANYIMRAVHVPAGQHTVTMTFKSKSVRLGIMISLITLFGIVIFGISGIYYKRRKAQPDLIE